MPQRMLDWSFRMRTRTRASWCCTDSPGRMWPMSRLRWQCMCSSAIGTDSTRTDSVDMASRKIPFFILILYFILHLQSTTKKINQFSLLFLAGIPVRIDTCIRSCSVSTQLQNRTGSMHMDSHL